MGKTGNPRHGSMQFWPRKRAKSQRARVRSLPNLKEAKPGFFAAYKAGMTHVTIIDNHKTSPTKGEEVAVPVTILECPPLTLFGMRAYKSDGYGQAVHEDLYFSKPKAASRLFTIPKNLAAAKDIDSLPLADLSSFSALVLTNPPFKKTPETFELKIGGSGEEQLAFIKEHINKPITVNDVFEEGEFVDARGVTKGKGTQGPVKRFGVKIRARKSEKTKRGPGSLGSWKGQQHMMYRIAFAGQMGYQQRLVHNIQILKITEEPVNVDGGLLNYGVTKNPCLLVKGSVPGPKKRLITLAKPLRRHKKSEAPSIEHVSTRSQQKR